MSLNQLTFYDKIIIFFENLCAPITALLSESIFLFIEVVYKKQAGYLYTDILLVSEIK